MSGLVHEPRPIFIVGVGRSGSTLLHELFCDHPRVAWPSAILARYPRSPHWHRRALNALEIPGARRILRRPLRPSEAYEYWERHAQGFQHPCRDLTAADVTERTRRDLRDALGAVVTARRSRLVAKFTGWGRVGFLAEIVPEARFIHIVRDGRAVANSLVTVDWWWGWRGPQNWRWGPLDGRNQAVWDRHDCSFLALAGIQWNVILEALHRSLDTLSDDRFTEVRYEDLCADPLKEMRRLMAFCDIDWPTHLSAYLERRVFTNGNAKYRTDLSPAQQDILHDVMKPYLAHYGYLDKTQ